MLNKDVQKLIDKFKIIASKRYIKGVNKNTSSIGLTFENELDKNVDSMYFPDYYGTEIKCTSRFSRYPISLFSVAFDGPTFPEIDRLIEKYGYYDKDIPDKKVLYTTVGYKTKKVVNGKYRFRLEVDRGEEKVYLCVYDLEKNLIERKSFIYFDTIYNHLILKLTRLAIINASIKKEENDIYFRYYKIRIYELISKYNFMELLENGTIYASLIARVSKSGDSKGKYKNKNLLFHISKDDINKLFKPIYIYDHDADFERVL